MDFGHNQANEYQSVGLEGWCCQYIDD